jgi:hypothetical protein
MALLFRLEAKISMKSSLCIDGPHNISVQATPVCACCSFLRQRAGAPDRGRSTIMKISITLGALLVCLTGNAEQPRTNCLSLLILTNEAHLGEQMDVPSGFSNAAAFLSDTDFAEFNVGNHTFKLTPQATQRLGAALWGLKGGRHPYVHATGTYELIPVHAPFVLLAFGKPVYGGVFCPGMVCSYDHADGVPRIIPENLLVRTNLAANVSFEIHRWPPAATREPTHDSALEDPWLIDAAREMNRHENRERTPNKTIQPTR